MKNKRIKKIGTLLLFLSIFCQISSTSLAKTTKKVTKTIETIKNGNLSSGILISEIFPNPKGTDTGKEWIELFNEENHNINLGNWSLNINNPNKNTKPKIIKFNDKTTIKANSYLVIESPAYKFSILNTNCKIELKDFVGKSIDNISYENSEENLSLSRIKISGKNKNISNWITPTKNSQNPIYYEISGKIEEKNINSDKNNQSTIKATTENNQNLTIYLTSKNNSALINNTIKENDQILFLLEKTTEGKYLLLDFKIEKQNQQITKPTTNKENWLLYSLIPILIGLIWLFKNTFGLHRIIKNLRNISPR